jgi:hypothetical protein
MRAAVLAALVVLLAGACSSSQPAAAKAGPSSQAFAGGCAGTVLTNAEPPAWAQGGWSHTPGTPWPVPWAMATPGDAVAFMFAKELVAGSSPRSDGSQNKVLWVVKDPTSFLVESRPLGQAQPVVTVAGGPSIVDVPTPGCWTFQLLRGEQTSVINLQVLPAGTLPT